ncbi:TonB-dependent receptor [Caulobacter sp.]|uniref:TonB-dependent receptor n=1 Tax=Caulobacter sp. TaxID=78 RepID=UPI0031DE6681
MRSSALCKAAAVAALLTATAAPGPVAAREPSVRFDLPAQTLGSALRAFGQRANRPIIFSEPAVRGKLSRPLRGTFGVEDALRRLIAGNGLMVSRTDSGVLVVSPAPAAPQAPMAVAPAIDDGAAVSELVVTGSRIRRTDPDTVAPVVMISPEDLNDRGFSQFGDLLNQNTSNTPALPIAATQGLPVLTAGRQSPNLFNLGGGRTLTLVNGRRMVTSGSGFGDRSVDANLIPAGLVQRVEVVQGGGAAIYGSEAIAGVVNYVLKRDFEGQEFTAQYGLSSRGDYPQSSLRYTGGRGWAGGRGNVAINLEWSRTGMLTEADRPFTASAQRAVTNPLNTSSSDGQPPTVYVANTRLWSYNRNGVIFAGNGASPANLLAVNGAAAQFSADGQTITAYDPGQIQPSSSVAIGGQGLDTRVLSSLAARVRRYTGALIGHYDLTPSVRLSGELIYGETRAVEPYGTQSIVRIVGGAASAGQGPIAFTRDNPFLTASQIAALSAASSSFAAGGPLYLSKFLDVLPDRERSSRTRSGRALVSLDGDFSAADRQFYWSAAFGRSRTEASQAVWAPYTLHLNNALNAVRNGAGQIVCAINADAITTNDDPACAPLNPFGDGQASAAARAYVSARSGADYATVHDDLLGSLGGDLFGLPGGQAQFSLAYEHRREVARYAPFAADAAGLLFSGTKSIPQRAGYHTNEYSSELLAPLLGGAFAPPGVERLELSGSYRLVDNSQAGREAVWGAGLRLKTTFGLSLRASRSRNFRAPTLDQQFAPATMGFTYIAVDPCDADRINGGPNPAARLANCQKEFAVHPEYGPLASFQDPAENTAVTAVTTGGNRDLKNETSHTLTLGLVYQPSYAPGLTISVDQIAIELRNGLSSFSPANYLSACYDSASPLALACETFTRDASGTVVTARQSTFNAGLVQYRGEVYNLGYRFALGAPWNRDLGTLELSGEATHTTRYVTSVTGTDPVHAEGTAAAPSWRVRMDARYTRGPLGLTWSVYHLPQARSGYNDTIETTSIPVLASNSQHSVSASYDLGQLTLRAGVTNLTDKAPSAPLRTYGDIIGRRWFLALRQRF